MEHLTRHANVLIDVGINGLRSKLNRERESWTAEKRILEGVVTISSQRVTELQATVQRLELNMMEQAANQTKLRLDTVTGCVVGIHLISGTDVTELLRPLLPLPSLSDYVDQLAHDGVRNPANTLELTVALRDYQWLPPSYQFRPVVRYTPLGPRLHG